MGLQGINETPVEMSETREKEYDQMDSPRTKPRTLPYSTIDTFLVRGPQKGAGDLSKSKNKSEKVLVSVKWIPEELGELRVGFKGINSSRLVWGVQRTFSSVTRNMGSFLSVLVGRNQDTIFTEESRRGDHEKRENSDSLITR